MNVAEAIKTLIDFGKIEKPLYVILYARDNNGNILSKTKYPIKHIFSHKDYEATITIEYNNREDITDE